MGGVLGAGPEVPGGLLRGLPRILCGSQGRGDMEVSWGRLLCIPVPTLRGSRERDKADERH